MALTGSIELPAPEAGSIPNRLDLFVVVVAGLVLFGLNVEFPLSGDAAIYADYVLQAKLDELTLHIGYYALLLAADRTFGALLGIPIQETSVWLNVVAGALTLAVAYLLALRFLGTRRDALVCVVVLALNGRMLANATTSEIYMTQTLLVLSSFWFFVRERFIGAGVLAGLAMLISPLSAFAYLFYPVYDYQRAGRIRWGVLLRLAGGGLAVYLPYLVLYGKEMLWGQRGLLVVNRIVRFDPMATLLGFPLFQFKTYTTLLLLLIPALFAVRTHLRFLALTLAVAIPHIYIILKLTSEDNVFILNTDFFFACWLVIGWGVLAKSAVGKWIAPLPLAGHLALLLVSGSIFRFEPGRGYAAEMRDIAQTYLHGRDAVLITDWTTSMSLTFYGRPMITNILEKEPLNRQIYDLEKQLSPPSPPTASEIFLLDPWKPGPLNRLLRSEASLQAQHLTNAVVSRAERRLGLKCTLIQEGTNRLYRCVKQTGVA